MHTYQGRNIKMMRVAQASDPDYQLGKPQVFVTFDDGSTKTVMTSEVKSDSGQSMKPPPDPPKNPAQPVHEPLRTGASLTAVEKIDNLINALADLRDHVRGV